MLGIGVQTKGIIPERHPNDGFYMIKQAGFDCVDFNLDVFLKNSDLYAGKVNSFFSKEKQELTEFFGEYRQALDQNGLKVSQMHAPYPVYVEGKIEQNAYMQRVVIPKSFEIGQILGAKWMVIHPFKLQYLYGIEYEKEQNLNYFKSLIPYIQESGVRVCMENLYQGNGGRITEGVCADPEDVIWYLDELNKFAGEELFGFCLDSGHLQLAHREPYSFIRDVGTRLKILHLHENDTVDDLHQMPFTFQFDWNRLLKGLQDIGFNGTLSFETFPCMNAFPRGTSEEVLRTIYEIGCYMREKIESE